MSFRKSTCKIPCGNVGPGKLGSYIAKIQASGTVSQLEQVSEFPGRDEKKKKRKERKTITKTALSLGLDF